MDVDVRSRWWLAVAVVGTVGALTLVMLVGVEANQRLASEEGAFERVSAAAYLVGMAIAAVAAFRASGWRRLFFAVWAVLSLVFLGEETSWLQHVVRFETPETLRPLNDQGEFNLHNLWFLQAGRDASFSADLSNALRPGTWLTSQNLFLLGFTFFFLVYPVLARVRPLAGFVKAHRLPCPGARLLATIWIPIVVSVAFTFLGAEWEEKRRAIAEYREMLYALSIAGFLSLAVVRASVAANAQALAPAARR